jgi:hypothetical protein
MMLLKLRSDECELTGRVDRLHLHHVIFRSQGGDDVEGNIVCMTDDLHDRYHRHDTLARLMLAQHIIRKRPDTMIYMALKMGTGSRDYWLEEHGVLWEEIRQWQMTSS